jgi:hypothetical protein
VKKSIAQNLYFEELLTFIMDSSLSGASIEVVVKRAGTQDNARHPFSYS